MLIIDHIVTPKEKRGKEHKQPSARETNCNINLWDQCKHWNSTKRAAVGAKNVYDNVERRMSTKGGKCVGTEAIGV